MTQELQKLLTLLLQIEEGVEDLSRLDETEAEQELGSRLVQAQEIVQGLLNQEKGVNHGT